MIKVIMCCTVIHVCQYTSLAVNQLPSFTMLPEPLNLMKGDNVTLECKATGKPVPHIVWYRNREIIHEDEHVQIASANIDNHYLCESRLSIRKIVPSIHAGTYTAEARNSVGKVTHDVHLAGDLFSILL